MNVPELRGLHAHHRLGSPRLLQAISLLSVLGGMLTLLSVVLPHANHAFDAQFNAIGGVLIVGGALMYTIARTRTVGVGALHVSTTYISIAVLAMAWLGMLNLGGVQAVFLLLLLGISASVGPTWWSIVFLMLQAAGYALVLATADTAAGFDRFGQWIVVTMGLVACLAYNEAIRRALAASTAREEARRAEREHEREQHAEGLERLNEELQHTSNLKSSFVAMASHELRTPLTAIEGFADTLQFRWDELDDQDKRSFVGVIDAQAQRLGRLVADLLTLSRIESGHMRSSSERIDLTELIERTVRENIDGTAVEIRCDPDVYARADPDQVQQVLVNFISNARAYGAPPIELVVTIDGDWVELVVRDHGPGVDAEFVPELFERFARSSAAERHDGSQGTGLGLSIVEALAEANRGEAWYRPNEPTGACFGVRLPRA